MRGLGFATQDQTALVDQKEDFHMLDWLTSGPCVLIRAFFAYTQFISNKLIAIPAVMLLLLSPPKMSLQLLLPSPPLTTNFRAISYRRALTINCKANKEPIPIPQTLAIASGLVSTPIIAWSLYTLQTTGCGLPPGPAGTIGALEGLSYLATITIVGWSIYTKAKTGSGLPSGPFGLLGAVEGFSYLSLVAILLVFGYQIVTKGSLPGPLPSDQCFG